MTLIDYRLNHIKQEEEERHMFWVYLCAFILVILFLNFTWPCWGEVTIDTTKAVIHHTASHDVSAEEIDTWHKQNGWKSNGYHYIIRQDGTIENGRLITETGAHALNPKPSRNHYIGIALTGNDDFTLAQKISLMKLLKVLRVEKVERHHEDCPGKDFDIEDMQKELDGYYDK